MKLPLNFDRKKGRKFVKAAESGEEGYHENVRYFFQLDLSTGTPIIHYYSEDEEILEGEELIEVLTKLGYIGL